MPEQETMLTFVGTLCCRSTVAEPRKAARHPTASHVHFEGIWKQAKLLRPHPQRGPLGYAGRSDVEQLIKTRTLVRICGGRSLGPLVLALWPRHRPLLARCCS